MLYDCSDECPGVHRPLRLIGKSKKPKPLPAVVFLASVSRLDMRALMF